jgi:hypothetical protein
VQYSKVVKLCTVSSLSHGSIGPKFGCGNSSRYAFHTLSACDLLAHTLRQTMPRTVDLQNSSSQSKQDGYDERLSFVFARCKQEVLRLAVHVYQDWREERRQGDGDAVQNQILGFLVVVEWLLPVIPPPGLSLASSVFVDDADDESRSTRCIRSCRLHNLTISR